MHLVSGIGVEVRQQTDALQGLAGWVLKAVKAGMQGIRVQGAGRESKRQLRIVETLTIGPKKQLVLVSCGGERFLIGTGPESVGTIVRIRSEQAGIHAVRAEQF